MVAAFILLDTLPASRASLYTQLLGVLAGLVLLACEGVVGFLAFQAEIHLAGFAEYLVADYLATGEEVVAVAAAFVFFIILHSVFLYT